MSNRSRQKHQNHTVTAQEKLADEAVAIDRLTLLAVRVAGRLAPHLLHIFQHHVTVAVESLDARQQFAVVAGRNQDLRMLAHGGLKQREGAGGEFVGLKKGKLVFTAARDVISRCSGGRGGDLMRT